jgi:superfamily II DNA or RNA helicase
MSIKTKDNIQLDALDVILKHTRVGVGITVGGGKTLLGLKHMKILNKKYFGVKALVVAPKKTIIQSWIDEAEKHDYTELLEQITFSTYLSLSKQDLDFDVIYLDECHSLKHSHDLWLNKHKGSIIGLTGTPPKRKGGEKYQMVSKYCPIKYTYLTNEAVNDKILNDYKITVHLLSLDSSMSMKMERGDKTWMTSEVKTYDYWTRRVESAATQKDLQRSSIMRMKAMQDFPSKEVYTKALFLEITTTKCIVFANTQKQADKLCKHSYHSKNSDSESNLNDFKEGKINKLSCVLQLSEGVNIPNLKEGIIMHSYGNNRKSSQRIGRLLRLNPDDIAHAHILCYKNTIDEKWVNAALADYDKNKIEWYDTESI